MGFNDKTGRLNLVNLIVNILFNGRNTNIRKITGHRGVNSFKKAVQNITPVQNTVNIVLGHMNETCPKPILFEHHRS